VVDHKDKSDVAPKSVRQPIKDWPATERPCEKLLQLGPEGLSDGELLAVLLRIAKSGQSAEDMGRQLLQQFDGISGIDRAHIEELLAVSDNSLR
jgi:DNA repair protein RadC